MGKIPPRQVEIFRKNPLYVGVNFPTTTRRESLGDKFASKMDKNMLDVLTHMLCNEPLDRLTCQELLEHEYFAPHARQFEKEIAEASRRDEANLSGLLKKKSKHRSTTSSEGRRKRSGNSKHRKSKKHSHSHALQPQDHIEYVRRLDRTNPFRCTDPVYSTYTSKRNRSSNFDLTSSSKSSHNSHGYSHQPHYSSFSGLSKSCTFQIIDDFDPRWSIS